MPTAIPESWFSFPPEILVVGDGVYPQVLSRILSGSHLPCAELLAGACLPAYGSRPSVLSALKRVFIAAVGHSSPGELIGMHDCVWKWVQELSPEKQHHRLCVQFILPPSASDEYRTAVLVGLPLPESNWESTGYGISLMSDRLHDLITGASRRSPKDFVLLRNRRERDMPRAILLRWMEAVTREEDDKVIYAAAAAVKSAFDSRDHFIDLFCREPRHPNGRRVRELIDTFVTGRVTHQMKAALAQELPNLLSVNTPL